VSGRMGKVGREENCKSKVKREKRRNLRMACKTHKIDDSSVNKAIMRNYAMLSFNITNNTSNHKLIKGS
jgi:hypothetical protein